MDPLARLEAEIKNLSSGPELLSQLKSFRAANASGFPALCRSIHGVVKEAFGVNVAQSVPRSGEEALKGATHVLRGLSFFSPRGKGDVGFFPNKLVVVPQKGGQVFEMFGPGATDSSADADIATVGIFENLPDAVNANKLFVFIRLAPTAEVFQELKSRRKRVTSIVLQVSGDQQLGPMPHPSGQAEIGRGPAAMVLAQALGSYGVRDWAAPNADDFLSASNHAAAAAYIKASRGWLIPLKSALCFLGSPCLYLPSASISHVEFLRANGHSQTFDLLVHCRDSGDGAPSDGRSTMHEFSNIDRTEAGPLKQYVAALRIPEGEAADSPTAAPSGSGRDDGDGASDDDDEEDDEDYDPDQPLPKRMRNADEAGPSTSAGFIASELGSEDMLDEDGEEEEEEEGSDAELVDEDDLSVGQLQALIQRQPSAG